MITTERLILRAWEKNNEEFITTEFGNFNVRRLMADVPRGEYTHKDAQFFIENIAYKENTLQLAFVNKETGNLIGGGGFNKIDTTNKKGEIGYWVAEKYWGKGYATEATLALLKHGFEVMKLHRIEINTESENLSSLAVIKKCGFTQEGVLRENYLFEDKWMNTCLFSMLKREWESRN